MNLWIFCNRRVEWIKRCGLENSDLEVNSNAHLCDQHFDDLQFIDPVLRSKLIRLAVPTVFNTCTQSLIEGEMSYLHYKAYKCKTDTTEYSVVLVLERFFGGGMPFHTNQLELGKRHYRFYSVSSLIPTGWCGRASHPQKIAAIPMGG